eukprot:1158414-Pelagomonas_calceolata.AAC.1
MARKAAIERAESVTARQTLDRTASATSTQTMGAAQQQWQQEQRVTVIAITFIICKKDFAYFVVMTCIIFAFCPGGPSSSGSRSRG